MSTQLGNSKRENAFDEKGEACAFCGVTREQHKEEYGRDLSLHHIIPSRKGGSDDVENLLPVCRGCHRTLEKTQGEALGRIAEREFDVDEKQLEQLRVERDKALSKVRTLERAVIDFDEVSNEEIANEIKYNESNETRIFFNVVMDALGRKVSVIQDDEQAFEEYKDWGGTMSEKVVSLSQEQVESIVDLTLQKLREK